MKKFSEEAIQDTLQRNGLELPTNAEDLSAFYLRLIVLVRTVPNDVEILKAAVKPLVLILEVEHRSKDYHEGNWSRTPAQASGDLC